MAETNLSSKAAESSKFTGKIKWLDSLGFGYIVSDNPFLSEVFVSPSSYSSNFIKEGDCVKFNINNIFGSNPKHSFEAINVTPYLNAKCCCCHNFGHELINCPQLGVFNDKCFHCGLIGHVSKDCDQKLRDSLFNKKPHRRIGNVGGGFCNGGGGGGGGCASESIVCVKSKEDVKKVEEVEDCFILEFDPTLDDDDDDDDDVTFIVCVKKMEDVKKVEEVEDCFILEFDPFELDKFSNLSLYEKPKIKIEEDDDNDDVAILAEKGKVACRDYPHPRHLCATHPFRKTSHELYCKMCYCYICDIPAPCNKWNKGFKIQGLNHCDAEFVIVKDASESLEEANSG